MGVPPGEAPVGIRQAWLGLVLPLPPGVRSRRRTFVTSGVVSRPRVWWQWFVNLVRGSIGLHSGYAVNALEAVNLLAGRNPRAAEWWREHCADMLDGTRHFVFPYDVCEECWPDAGGPVPAR